MIAAALTALLLFQIPMDSQHPEALKTRAELSNYEETSRYDDVIRFINDLQKRSDLIRVENFGETEEKRALPLMILSSPPAGDSGQAAASGKPIVFVMANIHAGEV